MKRTIVIVDLVILACLAGFFIGRGSSHQISKYDERAEKAWKKAEQADTPPVTEDSTEKQFEKVRVLYRKVFDLYPDSHWADDALYQYASRLARSQEQQFIMLRRLISAYPDSEYADDSLYAIAYANYRLAEDEKSRNSELAESDLYYNRALRFFEQLISNYPGSSLHNNSLFNRAMCYYGKGQWSIAQDEFRTLRIDLASDSIVHEVVYQLGRIAIETQQYEDAVSEFQNVVDSGIQRLAPNAQFGIAQAFFSQSKYEEAISAYERTIENYPKSVAAQDSGFYIGWAYQRMGKNEEAIIQLEEAISLYPRNENAPNSLVFIAQIHYDQENSDGAIESYRKVVDDNENFSYDMRRSALYWIGKIYEEEGDLDQAVNTYTSLVKDYAEHHQTHHHPSNNINEEYIQKLQSGRS